MRPEEATQRLAALEGDVRQLAQRRDALVAGLDPRGSTLCTSSAPRGAVGRPDARETLVAEVVRVDAAGEERRHLAEDITDKRGGDGGIRRDRCVGRLKAAVRVRAQIPRPPRPGGRCVRRFP